MDISNISGYIDAVKSNANASSASSKLQDKLNSVSATDAEDEKIMDVCKDFEAYFIEQIYKEMWKMVPESDEDEDATSRLTDYYKELFTQQMAEQTADQAGLGIAQQLYESMKRNYDI